MSKELKQYLIAVPVIMLLALLYILYCGTTLTMSLEMPMQATGGSVTTADESIIRVADSSCDGKVLKVTFEAMGWGSTPAHVNFEPVDNEEMSFYNLDMELSVTPFGGVYESISGVFTGWEILPTALMLFFLISSATLFRIFDRRRRGQLYSYVTVLCAGLGIFTLVLGLFALRFTIEVFAKPDMTLWLMYLRLATACQNFLTWTSPLVVIFSVALIISNISLLKHECFALSNLLGFAVALLMICGAAGGFALFYSKWMYRFRNAVCNTYAAVFCYFECMLFSTMAAALIAAKHTPAYDKDYIVILGCRIRPDGSLFPMIQSRVDKAMAFAEAQKAATGKEAIFLPSGGKGSDEKLSEAEGMARYLRGKGIDDERIVIEKNSTTTWENMILSKGIVEHLKKDARVAFATNNYHVFRSGILARQAGWDIDGMGSDTKWYFWPNAFAREFIGLLANRVFVHLAVIAALAIAFSAMTLIF